MCQHKRWRAPPQGLAQHWRADQQAAKKCGPEVDHLAMRRFPSAQPSSDAELPAEQVVPAGMSLRQHCSAVVPLHEEQHTQRLPIFD